MKNLLIILSTILVFIAYKWREKPFLCINDYYLVILSNKDQVKVIFSVHKTVTIYKKGAAFFV